MLNDYFVSDMKDPNTYLHDYYILTESQDKAVQKLLDEHASNQRKAITPHVIEIKDEDIKQTKNDDKKEWIYSDIRDTLL